MQGTMDLGIVNAAVAMKRSQTLSQVQVAVAKKVMDNDRMNGTAALKLLDAATQNTSLAGDRLVAAATGLGGNVDVYA